MTGQGRQGSVIQNRGKGTRRQAGSGSRGGRVVRQAGSEAGPAMVKTRSARKERLGKSRSWETKHWLTWQTIQTSNRQTENTGINKYTGEDGRHLEGVETSTRTGETDQGMTYVLCRLKRGKNIESILEQGCDITKYLPNALYMKRSCTWDWDWKWSSVWTLLL